MRKYKRYINRKTLIALSAALAIGFSCTAYASEAITVGEGTADSPVYAENPAGSTIDKYRIFKQVGGGIEIYMFYGFAALQDPSAVILITDSTDNVPTNFMGSYAHLVNNGVISLNYKDMAEKYSPLATSGVMMGRGMWAYQYSSLTNNGSIYAVMDPEDINSAIGYYFHAMYGAEHSTVTNNGLISLTGPGSLRSNLRGMTSTASNLTLRNYGTIIMDVDTSDIARAIAGTGEADNVFENYGTINVNSNAHIYTMAGKSNTRLANYGKITTVVDSTSDRAARIADAGLTMAGPSAFGMVLLGGCNSPYKETDGTTVGDYNYYGAHNYGVMDISVIGDYNEPTTPAYGIYLNNFTAATNADTGVTGASIIDTGIWGISNTGLINLSSVVQPSEENGYVVRKAEIAFNADYSPAPRNPVQAKIGDWATTLRDFGSTKDFIHVSRNVADSSKLYKQSLDFSKTNLILRPDENYTAGTSYLISKDTLVTNVDYFGDATDTFIDITGFDSMKYSAEMSDFITTDVTKVSDGNYQVSLVPNSNSGKTKELISAAAMNGVDFTRANIDQISHELERNDRLKQKWFITPYYSKFKRDEGMSGHAHGFIAGSDWQVSDKSFLGIHAAYALGGADEGIYSADSKLKSFLGGLHWTIYPQEDKNWIRTQATYLHNSGDTSYTMNTDTSTLNGKSSNKSDGFYLSANYGFKNEFSEQNELRTELGLSYLNMSDSPTVHWSLLDTEIPGYEMNFDKYNALHATAKTSLIHNFNDDGSLLFSLGVRGRLAGKKVKMNMMNTNYNDSVKEDSAQGLVELSYRHKINKFYIDAGYQGVFGSKVKNHLFHTALKWSF